MATYPEYTSYLFTYTSEGKRISGQLNLPNLSRTMPVVVMARGYVEKEQYTTGVGTKNAAAVYAKHGYITLAPDFSGYGESDPEDANALGARLTKPVEIIDLIDSLHSLPQVDTNQVYLWGHSNGGQIMLSVAEILGRRSDQSAVRSVQVRGLTLWAPVSKPFPYNILYYTDDADDQGKWLRHEIAQFEGTYDAYEYSLDRHLDWIAVPIQLQQGTADEAVPVSWSRALRDQLKEHEKMIQYYEYPGADHNLRPAWDTVVQRDLAWFGELAGE
jgi:dipeptidyl aminopeptidase/acylaminoacyl peptidase